MYSDKLDIIAETIVFLATQLTDVNARKP